MRAEKITMDEWQKELSRLSTLMGNGLTARELSAKMGKCRGTVMHMLQRLQEEGRLVVGKKTVIGIDGSPKPTACYSIRK